jgi:hypothetical protein
MVARSRVSWSPNPRRCASWSGSRGSCGTVNVFRTLQVIEDLRDDLAAAGAEDTKLATALCEFDGYLRANGAWISNYGERYWAGDPFSSAFRRVDR